MSNPLQRYFRQPAIYIKLPSDGKFYTPQSLEITANREFPVFPMTAMDEISMRTADGLFNGQSVVNVIKSCVPNILDPWQMPEIDMDTVLVAIRIASYGSDMDISTVCPACEAEGSYSVNLHTIMDNFRRPDFESTIVDGDLEFYFKPISYQQRNENSIAQFEDQKLVQAIPEADMPEEEKLKLINQAFYKLGKLSMDSMAESIAAIKADDELVTDQEYIKDFVQNCKSKTYNAIRNHMSEIRKDQQVQPLHITCDECQHQYETPFILDQANFFVLNS